MPYVVIEDFRVGQDNRNPAVAGVPGSLVKLENAHITRGGRIQRAKKFVSTYTLPAGKTFGLHAQGDNLFVFGGLAEPAGMPAGVTYQRLEHATTPTNELAKILDSENFDGQIYAVAEFANGDIYHYYDGSRNTSWDSISVISDNNGIAQSLKQKIDLDDAYNASAINNVVTITAAVPGVPFSISAAAQNFGATNDQAIALAETRANNTVGAPTKSAGTVTVTGGSSGTISDVTVNSVSVITSAVSWTTSDANTASLLAAEINGTTSTPNYSATAVGAVVTIEAAATGSGSNGFAVVSSVTGDVTTSDTPFVGGSDGSSPAVAQQWTATISGTFESADRFTITLDGVDFVTSGASASLGRTATTFKNKVYSLTQSLMYFSAINTPTLFGSGTGSGFVNFANQDSGSETLNAIGKYQGNLALFSRSAIQIEFVDQDEALNEHLHTIEGTGSRAPASVTQFGNTDVFYLDELSGIRSLRARDSSNAPAIDDVGVAIDSHVLEWLKTLTEQERIDARGFIADEGRFWLAAGQRIYVYTFFKSSKITAWSYYSPGFSVDARAVIGDKIYVRSGDTIYLYGGADGNTYPDAAETPVIAQVPYMDLKKPATFKNVSGLDIVALNTWSLEMLTDPNDDTVATNAEVLTDTTTPNDVEGPEDIRCTHFAVRATCSAAGNAELYKLIVHHDMAEAS